MNLIVVVVGIGIGFGIEIEIEKAMGFLRSSFWSFGGRLQRCGNRGNEF